MIDKRFNKLIYNNLLMTLDDVKDFKLEGEASITFPNGRMRMQNKVSALEGQKSNFVFWCPINFPSNIMVEWDFWPIREPGLCILFFCAKGINGEDLFSNSLKKRTGEYELYHHGDINAFHVSYFRRKYMEERAFHTCNLRKSYGFNLSIQGADPIPSVEDAKSPYHLTLIKNENEISFYIDDLNIFKWIDDGETYGPLLKEGKIGFRQMAPLIGEYANLRIYCH